MEEKKREEERQELNQKVEESVEAFSSSPDPRLRQGLARALGATGDKKWVAELSRMRLDSNPRVKSEALVAQVRLGHRPAAERLRSVLADPVAKERPRLVGLLAELSFAKPLQPFLAEAIPNSERPEQLLLATRLLQEGEVDHGRRVEHRGVVRR